MEKDLKQIIEEAVPIDRKYIWRAILVILTLAFFVSFAFGQTKVPSGYPYDKQIYGFELTSGFNAKRSYGFHHAWDIKLPIGTPMKAMMDGAVNFYHQDRAGMYVSIVNWPYEVQYMHLSKAELSNLKEGRIEKGQVIAYSGTSGESTGPHAHIVVLWFGKPVNPDPYFKSLIE